jgi:hypothetical protein
MFYFATGKELLISVLHKDAFNRTRTCTIKLFKFFGYPESVLAGIRQNIKRGFKSIYTVNFNNNRYIVYT